MPMDPVADSLRRGMSVEDLTGNEIHFFCQHRLVSLQLPPGDRAARQGGRARGSDVVAAGRLRRALCRAWITLADAADGSGQPEPSARSGDALAIGQDTAP